MRRVAGEHFYTVRGRGFTGRQWDEILELAKEISDRANEAGIKVKFEGDARRLVVTPQGGGESLVVWCKGEPGIPQEIAAEGRFDVVVQSVLTAIKKVAPDIFVMAAGDGRSYRRVLAGDEESAWAKMKRLDQVPHTKEEAFLKAMGKQKWRHPETHNMVEFISLPKSEQAKLRRRWEQEYGDQYAKALAEAKREVSEAERAVDKLDEEKEQAEKAKAIKPGKQATMNDETIRRAAIRVAHSTEDQDLKRRILETLRDTVPKKATSHEDEDDEKEARFSEGEDVDVGKWLRDRGYAEAARAWERYEGDIEKIDDAQEKKARRTGVSVVFPEVRELAWKTTVAFAHSHPESKTASGSTADRVAVAERLAKKWISDAIKRPGRVHKYLGVPEDEDIPMGKLDKAIEKVKGTGNKSLLSALLLAKRLKGMAKKKAADDAWLNEESFEKAATEVWGSEHLAKKWIQDAIKRPGRVRKYLGVPEGEDIPMSKLDKAIEKVKGTGNKSLLSALLLAKRLKTNLGKKAAA